jgi:hypothetical protein
LIAAVRIKALDCRLRLWLDPDIAHRADPDIEGAALRVDHQLPVLVALDDAKHALLGQHLGAIGAGDRLALIGRHIGGGLRRHRKQRARRPSDIFARVRVRAKKPARAAEILAQFLPSRSSARRLSSPRRINKLGQEGKHEQQRLRVGQVIECALPHRIPDRERQRDHRDAAVSKAGPRKPPSQPRQFAVTIAVRSWWLCGLRKVRTR